MLKRSLETPGIFQGFPPAIIKEVNFTIFFLSFTSTYAYARVHMHTYTYIYVPSRGCSVNSKNTQVLCEISYNPN